MPSLLVEKGGVARLHPERRQEGVLVRERIYKELLEAGGSSLSADV